MSLQDIIIVAPRVKMSIQFMLWTNKETSPKMQEKDNHSVCGYKLVFHLEYC